MCPLGALANAPLLMNNQTFANGCTIGNLGGASGTINMVPVYQKITSNTSFSGACTIGNLGVSSGSVNAVPVFERASYNCGSGYYLPADAIECVACLTGAVCAGGTYTFNETVDQGISCSGAIYRNVCHGFCSGNRKLRIGTNPITSYPAFSDKTNVPSPVLHIKDVNDEICYIYFEPDVGGEHGVKVLWTDGKKYHAVDPTQ